MHSALSRLIQEHTAHGDSVISNACMHAKWSCNITIYSLQSKMDPVHICAKYGHADLLDWLCAKQGASPTATSSVLASVLS